MFHIARSSFKDLLIKPPFNYDICGEAFHVYLMGLNAFSGHSEISRRSVGSSSIRMES